MYVFCDFHLSGYQTLQGLLRSCQIHLSLARLPLLASQALSEPLASYKMPLNHPQSPLAHPCLHLSKADPSTHLLSYPSLLKF